MKLKYLILTLIIFILSFMEMYSQQNISNFDTLNIGNDTTICLGDTLILQSNLFDTLGLYHYQWSTGDTTNSILVTKSNAYSLSTYFIDTTYFTIEDFASIIIDTFIIDTLTNDTSFIDTVYIGSLYQDQNIFDTISYAEQDSFSYQDTIIIDTFIVDNITNDTINIDTIIVGNIPKNSIDFDTIIFSDTIQVYIDSLPILNFQYMDLCYGDSSLIINNSSFSDEAKINYYIDTEKYSSPPDSFYFFINENGGEKKIIVEIIQPSRCYEKDSFYIEAKFKPILNFKYENYCFGDSSLIINNSIFSGDASVEYFINSDHYFSTRDSFRFYINENGGKRKILAKIIEPNGCFEKDSFYIEAKLTPKINISIDPTCENENLIINNNSSALNDLTKFRIRELLSGLDKYVIPSKSTYDLGMFLPGNHSFIFNLDNGNGCTDSFSYSITIFPKTNPIFEGLKDKYCVNDESSLLIGYPNGGIFSDFNNNIVNNNYYSPTNIGDSLLVLYKYKNVYNCVAIDSQYVLHVWDLPHTDFQGLKDHYCKNDKKDTLIGNYQGGRFYGDFSFMDTIYSDMIIFNPSTIGVHNITYDVIDNHGCYNFITKKTIVNPLPIVDLGGQDTTLHYGDTLILGSITPLPNSIYIWSNGKTSSYIEITNPGYYTLFAQDTLTGCGISDTINVVLYTSTNNILKEYSVKAYPIPFNDNLTIECNKPNTQINYYVTNIYGNIVKNGVLNDNKTVLKMSNLHNGTYFLVFNIKNKSKVIRIYKQ